MIKNYQNHYNTFKKLAIAPLAIGIAMIVFVIIKTFSTEIVIINLSLIIVFGFSALCSLLISFALWYTGWYYSDSAVKHFAQRADMYFGREWIDEVLDTHPRKQEIIKEYERLTRQSNY